MANKKNYRKYKYVVSFCHDCGRDFLSRAIQGEEKHKRFCPYCGDDANIVNDRIVGLDKMYSYKKPNWSEHEDAILIYGIRKGLGWKEVSKELEGRSPAACLARYNNMKRAKLLADEEFDEIDKLNGWGKYFRGRRKANDIYK